jgi:protein SCO1/2
MAVRQWDAVSPREQIRRRYFPDLSFTTQDGKRVRLYDDLIKDKIVVLNFMYAHCRGICVPVTSNLVRVQRLLGDRVGKDIFMYSFSLAPQEDTPAVLRAYAQSHGCGPGWTFLTGEPRDIETLRQRLGFVDPDPALDAERSNHIGMVRYGNEAMHLWAAFPGMSNPEAIAKEILWVDWPRAATGTSAR